MKSYWQKENKDFNLDIRESKETDVLIIGGGITGIMTCYELSKKSDLKIVLATESCFCKQVSSKTTAKITPIHNLLYQKIIKIHGIEKARLYFQSQYEAMHNIVKIIEKENIGCNLEYVDNYTFCQTKKGKKKLKKELDVLNEIGIKYKKIKKLPISLSIIKGFKYKENYIFHPVKYLNGIIEILKQRKNVLLLEDYQADTYQKNNENYVVSFKNKKEIKAKYVIVATHYPIFNFEGLYSFKLYQEKSYLSAFKTKVPFKGIYINTDLIVKSLRYHQDNDNYIGIILGNSHIAGKNVDYSEKITSLEKMVFAYDKDAKIENIWTNQDVMSIDYLPFIGQYSRCNKNMFVATAFHTWGMTNSHVAASLLTDLILEQENRYKELYNPLRFTHINSILESIKMAGRSIEGLVLSRLFSKKSEIIELNINEGKLITYCGNTYAAYSDGNKYYLLKTVCTHTGCFLKWNQEEKTWDCKCHGSRFDIYGNVIIGPANKNLELTTIDNKSL